MTDHGASEHNSSANPTANPAVRYLHLTNNDKEPTKTIYVSILDDAGTQHKLGNCRAGTTATFDLSTTFQDKPQLDVTFRYSLTDNGSQGYHAGIGHISYDPQSRSHAHYVVDPSKIEDDIVGPDCDYSLAGTRGAATGKSLCIINYMTIGLTAYVTAGGCKTCLGYVAPKTTAVFSNMFGNCAIPNVSFTYLKGSSIVTPPNPLFNYAATSIYTVTYKVDSFGNATGPTQTS